MIVIPLTYILPYSFGFGTDGVFMAEPVSNVLGGLASFLTMLFVTRKLLRKKRCRALKFTILYDLKCVNLIENS